MRSHVALLRAIAHVPMLPFRGALEELGLEDVASYGMSGNLMFNADPDADARALEQRIARHLDVVTFVRTRREIQRVVAANPFPDRADAAVLFLARAATPTTRAAVEALDFEGNPPRIVGRTVFYTGASRPRGRRTPFDFERALRVPGTFRSARVVAAIHARMSER